MLRILAILAEWLLKNAVQKILLGAGLGIVSYLTVVSAVKAAFMSLVGSVHTMPTAILAIMGMLGLDHVLGTVASISVFILTLSSGKLAIRKMS